MAIDQNYTDKDFRNAFEALLPPGKYWQNPSEGSDLDKLLDGVGLELKTTSDEIKIRLLFDADNTDFGWRIADYQALFDTRDITATVTDDPASPNWIYVEVDNLEDLYQTFLEVESLRLPHTKIEWIKNGSIGISGAMLATQFVQFEAMEAPYSGGVGFNGILYSSNQINLKSEV